MLLKRADQGAHYKFSFQKRKSKQMSCNASHASPVED